MGGRITVRVPEHLVERLRKRSALQGRPESEVVREALEAHLGGAETSAWALAEESGLVGVITDAPKDLSTSEYHFEGFGKSSAPNSD